MLKLLLINISKQWQGRVYREYPYGLGILATIAHNEGHNVRILDTALDPIPPLEVVKGFNPDVIGLSFMSTSVNLAFDLIEKLKQVFSGHLISGGVHTSLFPVDVVEKGIGIAVIGEGENVLLPLLNYLEGSSPRKYGGPVLNAIHGIVYRNSERNIIRNPPNQSSVDLDKLPIMNRHLFNIDLYSHHSILTSRGCPYQCRFCCSWAPGGKSGRLMSSQRITDELQWLVDNFGALDLYWADEIFFWYLKDRLEFCRTLHEKQMPIKWTAQLRADLLSEPLVEGLISAGCYRVCIGAESGSDNILSTANKKMTSRTIGEGIAKAVKLGLRTKTWWIVGLPGGDENEQLASLKIIERSRPHEVAIHQFIPLPGTVFWEQADRFGIRLPLVSSFDKLFYYGGPQELNYDYLSQRSLENILREYELRLQEMGYVPTDLADETTPYVYTSPFQQTTFKV